MKVLAIIQARMSSERLPQKVLKEINGKPMLMHIIDRIKRSKYIDEIVVATTTQAMDDMIEEALCNYGVGLYRGNIYNVLDRFYQCAKKYGAQYIVRLTADNPLIDVDLIDKGISQLVMDGNNYDYVALKEGYPLGLGVEVFTFGALKECYENATQSYEKEHVTPYIYCHEDRFNIKYISNKDDYSELRLTCDTPEDFELIKNIYSYFGEKKYFSMSEIVEYIKRHPELMNINKEIRQKNFKQSDVRGWK